MNYIIFEDQKTNLLSPFCDLHASFELRSGVFSNIERILLQTLNSDTIQLYVRKDIELIVKEKYPDLDINPKVYKPGIYLNGSGKYKSLVGYECTFAVKYYDEEYNFLVQKCKPPRQ